MTSLHDLHLILKESRISVLRNYASELYIDLVQTSSCQLKERLRIDLVCKGKGKVCIRAKWPIRQELIPVSVA